MATSPSPQPESQFSSLIYETLQQVQAATDNMLKMTNEIEENSSGITEEIGKCKESVLERKQVLEEEKETFQKAAFAALEILSHRY